jgi:tetratricopeptide (TPR) repeat protein
MSKKRARSAASSGFPGAAASVQDPWWRRVLREPLALGLAPIVILRPWLDGLTYPTDNFYYTWGILALFALWAAKVTLRAEPVRFGIPLLLLGGFWAVAAMTFLGTVQVDTTYRALVIWAGHLCLFILVTNGIRSRTAIGIVLVAFVTTSLVETIYSLIHFRYILPFVREAVLQDPSLAKEHFGTTQLNAALVHRLQVNRAFGSLLFPNALAAFLILSLPYVFTGAVHSVATLTRGLRAGRVAAKPGSPWATLVVGAATWLITVCVSYFLFSFIASFQFHVPEAFRRVGPLPLIYSPAFGYRPDSEVYMLLWILFVPILPLATGVAAAHTTRRYGAALFGNALRVWILPPLFLLQVAALWLTYSRGGVAALAAALVVMAALFLLSRFRAGRAGARATVSVAAALLFALLLAAALPGTVTGTGIGAARAEAPQNMDVSKTPPAPPPAPPLTITREGINLSMQDLMNPASFYLRLTYWQTGLSMAKHNFWKGVGLGNFGVAYPKYQRPKAGDVKAAHNDYLQALCETGIAGFLFFCAFWGYFAFWGARRLLRERDPLERWVLAGLYGGVLAFLIHSLVDFNFFNPALAFFAVLFAGIFLSRASLDTAVVSKKSPGSRLLAAAMLIGAALILGMAVRVYWSDYLIGGKRLVKVGDHKKMNDLYQAGDVFFQRAIPPLGPNQYPAVDIVSAVRLIPNRDALNNVGSIQVPTGPKGTGYRKLRSDEQVPPNAVFAITKPGLARIKAREYIEMWLAELAAADGIFPHNPDTAAYFVQWYDLLVRYVRDTKAKHRYSEDLLKWAEIAVQRAPEQSIYYEWLAKALWLRGNVETGPGRTEYFEKGIDAYKKATDLYPTSVEAWQAYGEALTKYGEAQIATGEKEQGEAHIAQGNEVTRHVQELQQLLGAS